MWITRHRGLVAGMAAIGISSFANAGTILEGRDPDPGCNVPIVDFGEPSAQAVITQ